MYGLEVFLQTIHLKFHNLKGKEKPRLLDYGLPDLPASEVGREENGEGITT